MGRFVIVAYTPKAGREPQLLAAVKKHLEVLQAEFGAACDYTPLSGLKEAQQMFAEFDAVSL